MGGSQPAPIIPETRSIEENNQNHYPARSGYRITTDNSNHSSSANNAPTANSNSLIERKDISIPSRSVDVDVHAALSIVAAQVYDNVHDQLAAMQDKHLISSKLLVSY